MNTQAQPSVADELYTALLALLAATGGHDGMQIKGPTINIMDARRDAVAAMARYNQLKVSEKGWSQLEDDARKFIAAPPYADPGNITAGDPYFDASCRARYGEQQWREACEDLRARKPMLVAQALSIEQINEIARRRGLTLRPA
jgi:hypothetical protein